MSSIDDVLIHNLALALSVEGLSSRIGHKKISATDIANDVNDYFKENGLDRSVNANLLGHCLSSFKSKLFNDAKLKQKTIQVKEIKFRPSTDDNDYNVKVRNAVRFLGEGDKTKITMRFKGREMAHQEFGMQMLERIRDELAEMAQVEQMPKLEGRQMVMVLAPKKKK